MGRRAAESWEPGTAIHNSDIKRDPAVIGIPFVRAAKAGYCPAIEW
jgi:hypothetical protein